MDYTAPVSRRTRAREAEIYRDLFQRRKKEKEKERESKSGSNVGFSSDSGVVFIGKEEAVECDSMKDSVEDGNNSRSGRGTMDDPFCIENDDDDDDNDEEDSDSSSGVEPSSDDDYAESSSDDSDDEDDSSDESYDIHLEKRHYHKRRRPDLEIVDGNYELVRGLWRRSGSDEEEDLFLKEGDGCNEVSDEITEKKKKRKEKKGESEKVKRTIEEASVSGMKQRSNGEDSITEKEKRTSGGASVSGSEFDEIDLSEESFTGVKAGNVDEVVQKVGSVVQRTRVGSSSARGKEKIGNGTVSQPFCIDHDDDKDEDEVEEIEEVVNANNKKQDLRKRERPPKRRRNRGQKALDVSQILLDSIYERKQIQDLVPHGTETPGEDGQMPQVRFVLPPDFNFGVEEPTPVEKSASELELDKLWEELDLCLAAGEIGSRPDDMDEDEREDEDDNDSASSDDEADMDTLCRRGKHQLMLDEQIGLICANCSYVRAEIRNILPSLVRNPWGRSDLRVHGRSNCSVFDQLGNPESDSNSHGKGFHDHAETVWDLIPGTKNTMYPHQQEGFEFIWKNIAGGIHLKDLKDKYIENSGVGEGCIISHAPGTGKTRLTIVFLQTYLKLYPKFQPVIIAPRSMLLTWEEEFHKWKVDIPFHNLHLQELSGNEDEAALSLLRQRGLDKDKETVRAMKLYTWGKGGSILGMTYTLFGKLVTGAKGDKKDKQRKILLEHPSLVVLDEGHTPRNSDSLIWQALSQVKTERRIILSGTPFQNNFIELYNTLLLVRPRFGSKKRDRKAWADLTKSIGTVHDKKMEGARMKKIRTIIDSVAHIHKGTVLESLPGLRDSVVILKPSQLQESLLQGFKSSNKKNQFEREHGESLISVHPSLLLKTDSAMLFEDEDKLKSLRSDPTAGVKTRFLVELIRLSEAVNEKVLVFSQYIEPLSLVMEQIESYFKWSERTEILYMDGKRDVKQRQASINAFNDPSSKVRVLLASTKACAEGINLVGASRVVLLDIVWNPSVERQAICRAYRLGQKKLVHIYRLITSGTMEEEKYSRQIHKDRLSKLVFSSNCPSNHRKILPAVAEDRILEEMVQHNKLKYMFEKITYKEKGSAILSSALESDL